MKSKIISLLILVSFTVGCGKTEDPKLAFEKGDYERSFELWQPLAEGGDLDAQNYIGVHYLLGLGVGKDYQKAFKWYETAAKRGHADAQRNLGDMYSNGRGVQQDEYKAFIWYYASSQQGNESAKPRLDTLSSDNNLSPNLQMHGKIEASKYILDPRKRFQSHDTYIDKEKKL